MEFEISAPLALHTALDVAINDFDSIEAKPEYVQCPWLPNRRRIFHGLWYRPYEAIWAEKADLNGWW